MTAAAETLPLSRWRASPRRLASLLFGLVVFGAGEALLIASELGNSPWTVFAEGLSVQTPLSVGAATVATSGAILLLWIPLRQRPGLGTIANAVVIGLAIDATLLVLPDDAALVPRILEVPAGIALVAVGSAFYLGAALGPGPRDGLMTGLHRVTGRPVALVRTSIELAALTVGIVLGGTFGPGTIAFALLIGPAVALALRLRGVARVGDL
ncbi:MAG TPA: hypothetical protein VHF89_18640 [Solirubrobacteraceae bacterium]|nr:hypothetical protein [Solirubrobacteraceae bacterium]